MIEIKFTLDPKLPVYDQLLDHVAAFFPHDVVLEAADDEEPVTRVTPDTPVETEPTEPKKRGRKPKAVSYTHLRAPRDRQKSRMPSSA